MKQRILYITRLLLVLIASLAVSCADEDGTEEPLPMPVDEPTLRLEMASDTRGEGDDDDVQDVHSVHIYVTTTDTGSKEYTEGDFFKMDQGWSSTASVKTGVDYYIYGFAPADICVGEISHLTGETTYENGAKLTLTDMNPVSGSDVGIVTGVKQVASLAEAATVGAADIPTGNFDYEGQDDGENFVCLKLTHLYAAVSIQAQVSDAYYDLRKIKVRKMELQSDYNKPTAVVTLLKDTETGVGSIEWSGLTSGSGSTTKVVIFDSDDTNESSEDDPLMLDTTVKDISTGYIVGGQTVTLITYYDILDKSDNTVRSNCTAANKLNFTSLGYGQKKPVTLLVDPSYLYQLSEPDAEIPNIKVVTP